MRLLRRFNRWMNGLSMEGQVGITILMALVVGSALGIGLAYGMSAWDDYRHPHVKFQWGEIIETGPCYKRGKSRKCKIAVRADDGRVFKSEYREREATLGRMLPITEYKDRGDDSGRTYFHFSMSGLNREVGK